LSNLKLLEKPLQMRLLRCASLFRPFLDGELMHILTATYALPQRRFQIDWPAVLPQQVTKCFIRQTLKINSLVTGQNGDGLPSSFIELDSLARHSQ